MPVPPLTRALLASAFLLVAIPQMSPAQEPKVQPTPFSVWLDLEALAEPNPPRLSLPIWLGTVTRHVIPEVVGNSTRTIFRLPFRRFASLNDQVLVRVFFDDVKGLSPSVIGKSAGGLTLFLHGPFGAGLDLPSSETISVPMAGVDFVEIEVPGDGRNVRGAFVSTLKQAAAWHALDFTPESRLLDPFQNTPAPQPSADDLHLYGRIRATLDPGVMKLTPQSAPSGTWEFELGTLPLLTVVTFEILNADALAAPELLVNGQSLGAVSVALPDLADPGYEGLIRARDPEVRFRYTGWLRCQKAVPSALLAAGANQITLRLAADSGPVAVRAVELQLKNN
jgi:hypothetical protein